MDQPTVILFDMTIDGAISAALAARALGQECQLRATRSERLPDFFEESVQVGLPESQPCRDSGALAEVFEFSGFQLAIVSTADATESVAIRNDANFQDTLHDEEKASVGIFPWG